MAHEISRFTFFFKPLNMPFVGSFILHVIDDIFIHHIWTLILPTERMLVNASQEDSIHVFSFWKETLGVLKDWRFISQCWKGLIATHCCGWHVDWPILMWLFQLGGLSLAGFIKFRNCTNVRFRCFFGHLLPLKACNSCTSISRC
jgi:hypothetical protein